MKTIGKTKIICFARRRHEKENRSVQCGFMRFFRFAELLPIGAGSAKRNDGPQCPPQAKFLGDLGCVLYKKTRAFRGAALAAGRHFLGIWGALYTKITLLGCIQERVSGAKHPPKSSKFSASGGAKSSQMGEINPPPCSKSGNNKGGVLFEGGYFRRYGLMYPF